FLGQDAADAAPRRAGRVRDARDEAARADGGRMSFDPLFDPDATPEEIEALQEKVRRDPEAAETAARLIYVDGLLWASARKTTARRKRWPWIMVALGAAAAAVVVALLLRAPSGAKLESEKGAVAFDGDSVRTSG